MEKILVLLHTESDGSICRGGLESLNASLSVKTQLAESELVIGIVGNNVKSAVSNIAGCGAKSFVAVEGEQFDQPRYCTDAIAIESIMKAVKPSIIIAPATIRWNRVVPGAVYRVGAAADTHITGVLIKDGVLKASRWYYRQRIEALIHRTQRPWVLLIDSGVFKPYSGVPADAQIEILNVETPETAVQTRVIGYREPPVGHQTIRPDAKLLFVAGAGWTKKQADGKVHIEEAEKLILDFLNLTRASLGSSKSLVDIGSEGQAVLSFLSHLNQIGQTGSTPRHPKGLATCCHGEEPHTVGWRFINERRAINLDPNCGWARGKADVLYVADAFAVMRKVNELFSGSIGKKR